MVTEVPDVITKKIKDIFKKADINQDGFISQEELKKCFRKLGEWSDAEFNILFGAADVNGDGTLCYDDFLNWLMQSNQAGDVFSVVPNVHIVDMGGNECGTYTLSSSEYVMDLKKRLSSVKDIYSKQLVFQDKVLEESLTVRECSIQADATMTLVTKGWPEAMPQRFRTPTMDIGLRTTVVCSNPKCHLTDESGFARTEGELRSEKLTKEWDDGSDVKQICTSWFVCRGCGEIGEVSADLAAPLNPFDGVYQTASVPSRRKEILCWYYNEIFGGGPQDEELDCGEDGADCIDIEGLVTAVGPGQPMNIFIRRYKFEDDERTLQSETKGTWTGRGILWEDGSFWEWIEERLMEEE